jgi:hypothetical protein
MPLTMWALVVSAVALPRRPRSRHIPRRLFCIAEACALAGDEKLFAGHAFGTATGGVHDN